MKFLILGAAVLASAAAQAETLRFYGYGYDLDSGRYLYTEVHEQEVDGDHWRGGTITYYDPSGKQIGKKTLDFSQDPYIPVYELELPYKGYVEGIRSVGDEVVVYKRSNGDAKTESESIDHSREMAADSGFHTYLRDHFDALMAGETLRFKFVVAGNLDYYSFRAKKSGDTEFEGKPAVTIHVEADSLLRLIAPDLDVVYDPKTRKLLEYRGVSNIHNPETGKPYDARIDYYSEPPKDAGTLPPLPEDKSAE